MFHSSVFPNFVYRFHCIPCKALLTHCKCADENDTYYVKCCVSMILPRDNAYGMIFSFCMISLRLYECKDMFLSF